MWDCKQAATVVQCTPRVGRVCSSTSMEPTSKQCGRRVRVRAVDMQDVQHISTADVHLILHRMKGAWRTTRMILNAQRSTNVLCSSDQRSLSLRLRSIHAAYCSILWPGSDPGAVAEPWLNAQMKSQSLLAAWRRSDQAVMQKKACLISLFLLCRRTCAMAFLCHRLCKLPLANLRWCPVLC